MIQLRLTYMCGSINFLFGLGASVILLSRAGGGIVWLLRLALGSRVPRVG